MENVRFLPKTTIRFCWNYYDFYYEIVQEEVFSEYLLTATAHNAISK